MKDGQSATATMLPTDITYTVVETEANKDGYTTTSENANGELKANSKVTATFSNDKKTGELIVSKKVSGNAGETEREFHFTVTLSDKTINGIYGGMTFRDGVAEFALKDGKSAKATDLPAGITYTVEEEEANQDGYTTSASNARGTILEGQSKTAAFENAKSELGGLVVKKIVDGNSGDKTKAFHFKVEITNGKIPDGKYGDMEFTNGVAEFALAHDQSATASDLPLDLTYTVTETDANKDGYITEYEGKTTNTTESGVVDVVVVTNTKDLQGDLSVTKKVEGNAGILDQEFSFRVELNDKSVSGKYGDMEFTAGVAEFTLKHDETKTAKGLPANAEYAVTETDQEGHELTKYVGNTGKIEANTIMKAEFTNTRNVYGKVSIVKVDEKNAETKLAGAVFELYKKAEAGKEDELIDTLTTDKNGEASKENLEPGEYYLVETKAPEGYADPDSSKHVAEFEIKKGLEDKREFTFDLPNNKEADGELEITKVDESVPATMLEGAKFDLYKVSEEEGKPDKLVDTLTTDKNGKASKTGLKPGKYYLVETEAPDGYVVPDPTEHVAEFTVEPGQKDVQKIPLTVTNKKEAKGEIMLVKTGKNNLALQGAEFDLYRVKEEGEEKDLKINKEPLVTDEQGRIIQKDLEPGTYYFVETKAPEGYVTPEGDAAKTATRTVAPGQASLQPLRVYKSNAEETKGELKLKKVDAADETKALANAQFELYKAATGEEAEDELIDTLTTDEKGEASKDGLEPGSYYLVETKAPAGYADSDPTEKLKEFEVKAGQSVAQVFEYTIENTEETKGKLTLTKTDKADGSKLAGAEFDLFRVKTGEETTDSKVNENPLVTDEAGQIVVEPLEPGTYYFVETKAPAGYVMPAGDAVRTEEATVLAGQSTPQEFSVSMENEKTSIKVSKVDVTDSQELEGAHIQILDKDGNVVEEWDSTKEAHEVKGLKTGETYTLRETVAPNRYSVTAETEFVLNADGTLDTGKTTTKSKDGVLLVEDSLNTVNILKVDESGVALAGAKLIVKDASGKIVDSWTTDGKAHTLTGVATGKYTLSEVEAPEGYEVSADVSFEITGTEAAPVEVTMTDRKAPVDNKNSLTVTKQLRIDGLTSVYGLRDAVFYVALFSDVARTQRVSSVKQIVFKDAAASSVTFNNLAAGTYYVGETDENGTPLDSGLFGTAVFTPEYTSEAQFTFEGKADSENAMFTNVFLDVPDGLYISGELTITKKILINGEEGTSDDTFYARVFSDAALANPVSDVLVLDLAGGSSVSATVSQLFIGVTLDSSATYYVAETDENGTPLDPDAITGFEISIDKSEVVLSPGDSQQEVVITNNFIEEEETETETESETEVSEKKTAPQTGDETNYMLYLLLMALSAGVCAAVLVQRRRRVRK